MVGRPTRRAWIGCEGMEKSDNPLGGPGGVGNHYRLARSGWEALLDGWEGLEDPSGWLGGVGRPIRMVVGWKPSQKGG